MLRAKLSALWRYYATQAPALVEHEVKLRRRLTRDWEYQGRADGICATGELFELKTTSKSLDEYKSIVDHQVQTYLYTWALGTAASAYGTIVDVVHAPLLRLKKDETLDDYTQRCTADAAHERHQLPYSTDRIDAAVCWLKQVASSISRDLRREPGTWPHRVGWGCRDGYGWCRYKSLCWDNDVDRYYTADVEHEELI